MKNFIKLTNHEGYLDPTVYSAIKEIELEELEIDRERKRYNQLIKTILYICNIAGFHVQGRITLRDKKSGKIWR